MTLRATTGQSSDPRKGRVLFMETFRRTVANLDQAVAFYCDGLGFELDMVDCGGIRGGRRAVLTLGSEALELISIDSDPAAEHASHEACSSCLDFQHIAIVVTDMPAAFARLDRFVPRAISRDRPILLPESSGGVTAFKFRDPDGHPLELLLFPEGVGDPKWHRCRAESPTIGIDHSAIVVSDADRSIAFYEELLGFSVTSRQVNRGPAQDALDGTPDVIVDVIALTAAESRTPHLELLGYRQPTPSAEASQRPSAHTKADQIVWAVEGLVDIIARLKSAVDGQWRMMATSSPEDSLLIVDPDGHAHHLVEGGEESTA
jgi:catechol 2,3-dioxygenase-like lactoylglutathione lyase family enzyme